MADFSRITDHGDDHGHCKGCRHWHGEHDGPAAEHTALGLCMQPELTHFSLQVSGDSGCNHYEPRDGLGTGRMMQSMAG